LGLGLEGLAALTVNEVPVPVTDAVHAASMASTTLTTAAHHVHRRKAAVGASEQIALKEGASKIDERIPVSASVFDRPLQRAEIPFRV